MKCPNCDDELSNAEVLKVGISKGFECRKCKKRSKKSLPREVAIFLFAIVLWRVLVLLFQPILGSVLLSAFVGIFLSLFAAFYLEKHFGELKLQQ